MAKLNYLPQIEILLKHGVASDPRHQITTDENRNGDADPIPQCNLIVTSGY